MCIATTNSNSSASSGADTAKPEIQQEHSLAEIMEENKSVVTEQVALLCTKDSPFEDLRILSEGIEQGLKLHALPISGGKTNYAYKVHLENDESNAVFCKICSSKVAWSPDPMDLERTDVEFRMMQEISHKLGNTAPIAKPYHLVEIAPDCKLVVSEWAKADEQWCNQFIEGKVDPRVAPKVAQCLAKLNSIQEFDCNMNEKFRSEFDGFVDKMITLCKGLCAGDATDKCIETLQMKSESEMITTLENIVTSWSKREVLCHNDTHVFNILVEKKPDPEALEDIFGPKGDFILCDWELACVGPRGSDVGRTPFFPLVCVLCHAAKGNKSSVSSIMEAMDTFWDAYAENLKELRNTSEEELAEVYRNSLGWTGFMMFVAFYLLKFFQDVAPLDGLEDSRVQAVLGAAGHVGWSLIELGFEPDTEGLSLQELRRRYHQLMKGEANSLLALSGGRTARRHSSILRSVGRRVSDSSLYDVHTAEQAFVRGSRRISVLDPLLQLPCLEDDEETD